MVTPVKGPLDPLQKAILNLQDHRSQLKRRVVFQIMSYSLYIENSKLKSEGRIWRKCRVCRCYSTTCTLADLGSSSLHSR
jgi:hypothetical protein